MSKYTEENKLNEVQTDSSLFLKVYNKTIPAGFPRASQALLQAFREAHPRLFENGDLWSLDQHRKRLIDWLSRNPKS